VFTITLKECRCHGSTSFLGRVTIPVYDAAMDKFALMASMHTGLLFISIIVFLAAVLKTVSA